MLVLIQFFWLFGFGNMSNMSSTTREMESRIVGGAFAYIQNYAHSALLTVHCEDIKSGKLQNWVCGGSVLNHFIVLSAAHCFEDCNPKSGIVAHVGAVHRAKAIQHLIYQFMMHERYDGQKVSNDISLLKVVKPFQLGSTISRVSILRNPPRNEMGSMAGWGLTDEIDIKKTDLLKQLTQISIYPTKQCKEIFIKMLKGTFCGGVEGHEGDYTSNGDSGSALVIRDFIQVGIVSYKNPSFDRTTTVYTNISYYYDWIMLNSRILYCKDP